ncbi:MAG: SAM-dependent methyltransferase [Candidatus Cryptobacteroides sp.]
MGNKLYLVPAPLGEYDPGLVIPGPVLEKLREIRLFVVEELRTARRYLSQAGLKGHIQDLEFHELNEHSTDAEVEALAVLFERGDVAMISEAGLPAVADPGAKLVGLCHRRGIRVVPLVGPSSMMLALMSSGLNGQSFEFCGYLPAKTPERRARLKEIERNVSATGKSHIFIETPYRNDSLLEDFTGVCHRDTLLCAAADITTSDEFIATLTAAQWKDRLNSGFRIGKRPCVFIIGKWF